MSTTRRSAADAYRKVCCSFRRPEASASSTSSVPAHTQTRNLNRTFNCSNPTMSGSIIPAVPQRRHLMCLGARAASHSPATSSSATEGQRAL
jgi:hypothetical protein